MSDAQLLREYARNAAEAAFRELVSRHTDLVYSAALRQVTSPAMAREIAQTVFTDLARKAPQVSEQMSDTSSLAGWLYRSTRFAALNALRDERRRTARERQAMEQMQIDSQSAPDWELICPALDGAMADLNDDDREALLLRYFKNQDFRVVGRTLGISDDAAQKRVSRAIERLRDLFDKRGIAIGATGLTAAISVNAIQAAPAGLALTLSSAALTAGTVVASTAVTTTMNWFNMKTLFAIITSAVVAGTTTHLVERRQINQLQATTQQLVAQTQSLTKERDEALNASSNSNDELARLRQSQTELLRLRAEATQSRTQAKELAALRVENQKLATTLASQPRATQVNTPSDPDSNQATCINQLRTIDGAMQQCALEQRLSVTNIISTEQILPYLQGKKLPLCPAGGTYTFGSLTNLPTCSVPGHAIPK